MSGRGAPLFPEVVVNGERVLAEAIAIEAQNHPVTGNRPGHAWRKAAAALAIRALLLQEAGRRSISAEPKRSGNGVETEDEAVIRSLLESAVTVDAVDDGEIRAEWARDPSRFRAPPLWEVSHILLRNDSSDPAVKLRTGIRASEIAKDACAEPRRFPELARCHSECDSARSGGSLGQLRPGDSVPEFEAALRTMDEGEVSARPVPSRFGLHVIRLDAVAEGRILPFGAVRQKVSEALEKAAWTRSAREFVDRLVAAGDIRGVDLSPGSSVRRI